MIDVVIPTLNECHSLPHAIHHLRQGATGSVTIYVADCGSHDGTHPLAVQLADHVSNSCVGRSAALQQGASFGNGAIILFLHADTILPPGWDARVRLAIDQGAVGGAFDFRFGHDSRRTWHNTGQLRVIEMLNRMRFRIGRRFYGDQAIFVRRDVFEAVGGYPRVELMEEARLCERLRRAGSTAILQPPVRTSPRRFLSKGVAVTFALDLLILAADSLACEPAWMARRYRQWNQRGDVLFRNRDA